MHLSPIILRIPANTLLLSLLRHKQETEVDISTAPTPEPRDITNIPSIVGNVLLKS